MSLNTILATAPLTTTNYILKATGTTIGNSLIWDNGTNVGIGNTNTSYTLDVSGTLRNTTSAYFATASGSVGIGTTNTNNVKLEVSATTVGGAEYSAFTTNQDGGVASKYSFWRTYGGGSTAFRAAYVANYNQDDSNSAANDQRLVFATKSGTAEPTTKMTITGAGNVGIGTSSPTGRLMLYQGTAGNVLLNITSPQGGSTQAGINFSPSMTDSELASNPAQASIYATDSNFGANIIFANKSTGAVGNSLTERMRITSGGNVGIGTSSPSDLLTVAGTIVSSNATANTAINPGYIQANYPGNSNTAGSAVAHLRLGDTTNSRFWMQQIDTNYYYATFYFNGGVWSKVGYQTTGGTWTNSDERRKENIELSTYGLNEILQLIPKKFNFKIDERKIVNLGFIAQDVLPIIPEAVQSDIDDTEEYYAMNYANLVPVLVKAIQEQNQTIQQLSKQNEELSNRLNKAGL
jgi:hypothetical protein